MSTTNGINLDAIYQGDPIAIGDAIRNLAIASAKQQGVLPVLTDRVIVPTFADSGLLIETEAGQPVARWGGSTLAQSGGFNDEIYSSFLTDVLFNRRILVGDAITVPDSGANWLASFNNPFGPSGSSTQPGLDAVTGLNRILYRATPSAQRRIDSIKKLVPNSTSALPYGQIILLWNDSSQTLILEKSTTGGASTWGHTCIGNGPFTLGPQGIATLVQVNDFDWGANGDDEAWLVVGVSNPGWASYTPTWTTSGTQPDVGTGGSIDGSYITNGKVCRFWIRMVLGTGFSFGTGNNSLSLPFTGALPTNNRFPCEVLFVDTSTAWSGIGRFHNSTGVLFQVWTVSGSHLVAGTPNATTPFTWAAGDQIYVSGEYPI